MTNNLNEKMVERFFEGFDDMKERLIRIEENVKTIQEVQKEMTLLGSKVSENASSVKSAHKRLDKMEAEDKQKVDDIRFLKRTAIGGAISLLVTVLAGVILAAVKGWI